MSANTADIVAATGASFTFTTTSGTVVGAIFQGSSTGQVSVANNAISVSNVPSGDSTLLLTIVWAPGEDDAALQITKTAHPLQYVTSASILTDGVTPGVVELFGQ